MTDDSDQMNIAVKTQSASWYAIFLDYIVYQE